MSEKYNSYRSKQPWHHKLLKLSFHHEEPLPEGTVWYSTSQVMWRAINHLPYSWLALLFSIVICYYSYGLDAAAIENSEKIKDWFTRSGAVLVAASIWVEWNTSAIQLEKMAMELELVPTKRYYQLITGFHFIALFAALLGTGIWAYGDLLFDKF